MDYGSVLKKIKPPAAEEKKVDFFSKKVLAAVKKASGLDAIVCGSLGKGTWLSGNHDIDIFVMFPKETHRNDLEKKGLGIGAAVCRELGGKSSVRYAEHPYTMCMAGGFKVDIVPCYRIRPGEPVISAVDRSPLHLEFVKDNLKGGMEDEVRLLKQFCKASGIYGSDTKTQGFSGYICELLVLKYGSFEKAMKAAAGWNLPYTVDLAGRASSHEEIFVVVDPTDARRNAAAVVSPYNIVKFIKNAKGFSAAPSPAWFVERKPKPLGTAQLKELKARGTHFICLSMKKTDIVDDTLYPQARRAVSRLSGILKHNEFLPVRGFEYIGKEMIFFFELELGNLPDVKKMTGPPLFARKHVEEFVQKYGSLAYVEGSNVCADRRRDYKTPAELFGSVMKKSEKDLAAIGIPEAVAKPLKSAKICENEGFFRLLKSIELSDLVRRMYFENIF